MGGVPSREANVAYSYARGTYEVGLIPLTSAFFGRSSGCADNDVLRNQFLLMRGELTAALHSANCNRVLSWTATTFSLFTEEDLDGFLELVDSRLYPSDASMVEDEDSPLFAVPCAVCLFCKDGRERRGGFQWRGRNINIIGYFGCMDEELDAAFKIERHRPREGLYGIAAAVYPSIGDRTFDRVLALAPVMLQSQFIRAVLRLHPPPRKYSASISSSAGHFDEAGEVRSFPPFHGGYQHESALAHHGAAEYALSLFERRINQIPVFIEVATNNYSSLKSLVENAAFISMHNDTRPDDCTIDLPSDVENRVSGGVPAGGPPEGKCSVEGNQTTGLSHSAKVSCSESTLSCGATQGVSSSIDRDELAGLMSSEVDDLSQPPKPVTEEPEVNEDRLEPIRITFSSAYVRQSIIWISDLFRNPMPSDNGCWVHYCLKREEEKSRKLLSLRDSIVSSWRTEHPDLANWYLGSETMKLLEHVRILQQKVEAARLAANNGAPQRRKVGASQAAARTRPQTAMVLSPPPATQATPYVSPPPATSVYLVQQQPAGVSMCMPLVPFHQVPQTPQLQYVPQLQHVAPVHQLHQIPPLQHVPQLQQVAPVQHVPVYHVAQPELQRPSVCYVPYNSAGTVAPGYIFSNVPLQ